MRSLTSAPGSRAPRLWQTVNFIFKPTAYMRDLRARHGDLIHFNNLLGEGLAICDATIAKEVFAMSPDVFDASPAIRALAGEESVISTSGAKHKRQRKLLNPHFASGTIRALLGSMQRVVDEHLERGLARNIGRVVKMTDVTQALTLDVILEGVFGDDDALDRDEARAVLLEMIHEFSPAVIVSPKLHRSWYPPWRKFIRARDAFDRWTDKLVAKRRADGATPRKDVLGMLVAARYDDGQPMSDVEIRAQLLTLLIAGHETSAIAMAWAVYWLARSPDVLATLRAEVGAESDSTPEALTKNEYLDAVVSEVLRIAPVASDVARVCRVPVTIGGYEVPPGKVVAVMLDTIMKDPKIYPEPERFRPERFLERTYHVGEFLPFGGGTRRCLGAAFAQAELAVGIGTIARSWDLTLADHRPEKSVRRNVTMGPKNGVRVKVIGRRRLGR